MFLRQEQNVLLDHLARRSISIAGMYVGGLRVFADDANPHRFPLAAHAFREVLKHSPRLAGERVVFGDGMKNRIQPVRKAFLAMKQAGGLASDPTTSVVGLSEDLNDALDTFFNWMDNNRADVRKQVALVLTQLSGAGPALPSDVVAAEITDWMKSNDYFNGIAHAGSAADRNEFVGKLYTVEDILLRHMQPRPVSDLDEIDALLGGGSDAN